MPLRKYKEDISRKMPENPTPTMSDPSAAAKRYTPPNQRNRSLNRRKSGDRTNSGHGNDGDKNQLPVARNASMYGYVDADNSRPILISLEGSCGTEAYQFLNQRWAAVMHLYNNPTVDLSERPAMYTGSNPWARLPHQMVSPGNNIGASSASKKDFLGELHRAMQNAKSSSNV